mgnify:CR=1 FL=1
MPDKFLLQVPETTFVFPTFPLFALDYHFGVRQSSHKMISHDIHYFDLRIDLGTFPAYREHKKQVPGSPRVPSRVADMEQ